jgi:AraC-like DNA-binding protein
MKTYRKEGIFRTPGYPLDVHRHVTHIVGSAEWHRHTFSELVIITCGTARHVTGEQSMWVRRGDILVINGGRAHTYADSDDFEITNVLYDPDELSRLPARLCASSRFRDLFMAELSHPAPLFRGHAHLVEPDYLSAKEMAYKLALLLQDRAQGFEARGRELFARLLMHISWHAVPVSGGGSVRGGAGLAKAMVFLEDSLAEPVSLQTIADVAGVSKSTIQCAFRKAIGRSPIEHLIHLRIDKAKHLLQATELNVTDIAFLVGFQDSNFFSRTFRRLTGTSPSQYRQRIGP